MRLHCPDSLRISMKKHMQLVVREAWEKADTTVTTVTVRLKMAGDTYMTGCLPSS